MLSGKKIIVTGGCAGLGGEFSKYLLTQGAIVYPTFRSTKSEGNFLDSLNYIDRDRCHPRKLDLENHESVEQFLSELESENIIINGLVNNAVCRSAITNPQSTNLADWEKHFRIDVFETANMTAQIIERFLSDKGSVVFISSIYSELSPDYRIYDEKTIPTSLIYGASKATVNYITKYMAVQYAKRGVRVNALLLGGIRNTDRQGDYFYKEYCNRVPMRRMGDIDDFNAALNFCLTDEPPLAIR